MSHLIEKRGSKKIKLVKEKSQILGSWMEMKKHVGFKISDMIIADVYHHSLYIFTKF